MAGPVSMSTALPEAAQQTIANFYHQLRGNDQRLAAPRIPFEFDAAADFSSFNKASDETEYKQAYSLLKEKLDASGVKVPVLYKQYVELCEPGGCEFLGFNIDPQFSNCVDALILVHVGAIKEKKHQRYIESHAAAMLERNSA